MSDRAIQDAISKLAGQGKVDQVTYVNAVVDSVDIGSRTCNCTVIDGHTEYELPNVRLMAVVDDGLFIQPAVGSIVKVIFSQKIEPFVCQYSEIENITIDAKTSITLNDGSFGGMVKIKDLITKLNAIEKDINSLKSLFSLWTVIPSDGAASLKAAVSVWAGRSLAETVLAELENQKVSHGK
jgi:hypothetical protein